MPVPSEEGTIGLESAGVDDDRDKIGRLASKTANSWVRVVLLGPLGGMLPRLLLKDLGSAADLERSAAEKGG